MLINQVTVRGWTGASFGCGSPNRCETGQDGKLKRHRMPDAASGSGDRRGSAIKAGGHARLAAKSHSILTCTVAGSRYSGEGRSPESPPDSAAEEGDGHRRPR